MATILIRTEAEAQEAIAAVERARTIAQAREDALVEESRIRAELLSKAIEEGESKLALKHRAEREATITEVAIEEAEAIEKLRENHQKEVRGVMAATSMELLPLLTLQVEQSVQNAQAAILEENTDASDEIKVSRHQLC